MRKGFLISFLLGLLMSLQAQQKQLLYDFNEIPQSLLLNPGGQSDLNWYVGIPVLSGLSFQAGSSGITVYDIFADDGINVNDKIREKAIYGMDITDDLSGIMQIEFLSGGFRSKKNQNTLYTFGMYLEGDAIGYWFKDLAQLGYDGNANQYGRRFDLSHLKTRGEFVNVFHFGITKNLNREWTIGARGKIYSGIVDFNSTKNSGYFVTDLGQNNLVSNTLVSDMELRTSGAIRILDILRDDNLDQGAEITNWITKRAFFGGDLGLGVDLGFTHYLNDQTTFTASLLDVGFIYHYSNTKNYQLTGSATNEGVEVILPDALIDPGRDFWEDLVNEIDDLVPHTFDTASYITFRPTKLYSSIRYNFGEATLGNANCDCDYRMGGSARNIKYGNAVGGQVFVINRPRGPQAALTAFYQRNLGNSFSLKTTYTISKFSLTNVGLGMNLQAGPVNFYLLADNLLPYFNNIADTHYASFQLGLNILSWGQN